MTGEAAASDRQGMLGGRLGANLPGASYLHAGNHFMKLGSNLKIPGAQDV